jgi:hypothetical protein
MRTKFLLFFFPVLVFSFFSCDVMKKRYSSGFYFSRSKTLPSVIEKDLVHLHNNTTVNHTSYGNQPNSSAKEKNEAEMVFANSVTNGNDFSLKKQESLLNNNDGKTGSVADSLIFDKTRATENSKISKVRFQDSRDQTHIFISKKTSQRKAYNQILKKISSPKDIFRIIGRVLLVILLIILVIYILAGIVFLILILEMAG